MKKIIIYFLYFCFFLLSGCENSNNKKIQFNDSNCENKKFIDFELPKNEILSKEININGGILQGKDNNGQWIILNIPPKSINKNKKINLNIKKSDYKIKSGIKSNISFSINPNIYFNKPIRITVIYDKKYNCKKISTIVPYLINKDKTLKAAQLVDLDKNQNIFTMDTFQSGTYSWVYIEKDY